MAITVPEQADGLRALAQEGTLPRVSMFAVFDGHGGKEVAKFCRARMPNEFMASQEFKDGDIGTALVKVFHRMDEMLWNPAVIPELEQYKKSNEEDHGKDSRENGSDEARQSRDYKQLLEVVKQVLSVQEGGGAELDPPPPLGVSRGIESESHHRVAGDLASAPRDASSEGTPLEDQDDEDLIAICAKASEDGGEGSSGGGGGHPMPPVPVRRRRHTVCEEQAVVAAEDKEDETTTATATATATNDDNDDNSVTSSDNCAASTPDHSTPHNTWAAGAAAALDTPQPPRAPPVRCELPDVHIRAGCTSVVGVVVERTIWVANAGDSRAVLCRAGRALPLSDDHKPQHDTELRRIEAAGGFVNAAGRVNGNLNLSRSIGDLKYKQAPVTPAEQMITAEPDIRKIDFTPEDAFIILACDGIWDCMTNQEACDFVSKHLEEGMSPMKISEAAFDHCISFDPRRTSGLGGDNMTCVIVTLHEQFT
eukprot:CAMPEP_0185749958 /NCGR_PEP_ID=MMETSP1174-20130828/8656_1 /TAXON_ID=35687 /ORGANISM="Dictyocha speculum, Strain CCMP1381" /LENGTH=479 /DNA_ID=CAMNT_0028426283 /DNA_START=192 /DNA_END=1631 /DNA_ORIENTATION=+